MYKEGEEANTVLGKPSFIRLRSRWKDDFKMELK
jgi:hypothetical protein